ncbi:hypothetical protein [Lentzea sp. NPDC055074]
MIISEYKDTAIHFPPLPGGIDAHGYEILNGWRGDGVPAQSILVDPATHDAFEPCGTNCDRNGQPLKPQTAFATDICRTSGLPPPSHHVTCFGTIDVPASPTCTFACRRASGPVTTS